jgi:hypothetical protein
LDGGIAQAVRGAVAGISAIESSPGL